MCRAECYDYGPMGSCPERMDNAVVPCGSLLLDTPVRQCMHKVLGAQFEIGRVNITCISA
ncbi:hypothetical protein KY289_016534 [Solanum tuberosum]|nr:hypothetical protein KY289_016534 [Solanum tuberosum]